jgi:hypothetical protein
MRNRGEPEGGPEERKRQFEDQRGLGDSPELPLDPEEDPDEADPDEKDEEENDTAGGKE